MLPRECAPDTPSRAERRLFTAIESELSEAWVAMHSLGIARHGRKPWAEADFVLIGPGGVFVVEVKGGSIRRQGRRWTTNGKLLKQSPIDQAAGAAAALYADLSGELDCVRATAVGHAVCFPDVVFDVGGADVDADLVYHADDVRAGFDTYVERVVGHWHRRLASMKGAPPRPLSPTDIQRVVDSLAPDFDLAMSLRATASGVGRDLVRLTAEQVAHFSGFDDNPRVMVRGGAGTGKTLLAIADAERAAAAGVRVLFVCQSNPLRDRLREQLADRPGVDVFGFQELCGMLISQSGVAEPPRPARTTDEYFDVLRPTVAMEGWAELTDPPEWDLLVVDEAQDLLTGPASELLELLVRGGWQEGRWRIFYDPVQDLFGASHTEVVQRVGERGFRVRLTINCRNSAPIARDTAIATSSPLVETLPVEGPEPTWVRYRDEAEQRKQVGVQLRTWIDGGIDVSDIAILSVARRENSVLAEGLPPGVPAQLVDGPVIATRRSRREIQFCTVASFKGLEADAVLLLDAPYLGRREMAGPIYVGMTRARALLTVLRHERFDDDWTRLEQEFGRRLVEG